MRKILPIYGLLSKAIAASKTLNKIINSKPMIDSLNPGGMTLQPLKGDIKFQNIDFSYSARSSVAVLQDLSIHFEAGKTTALVGASGSGKSTIVGLLERWYDPLGGTILVDDCRVDKLNVKFWRSNIGLVQQVTLKTSPIRFHCLTNARMLHFSTIPYTIMLLVGYMVLPSKLSPRKQSETW
jgi:ATP-binding cassette subfamily B (MDR/TAP) protein 1